MSQPAYQKIRVVLDGEEKTLLLPVEIISNRHGPPTQADGGTKSQASRTNKSAGMNHAATDEALRPAKADAPTSCGDKTIVSIVSTATYEPERIRKTLNPKYSNQKMNYARSTEAFSPTVPTKSTHDVRAVLPRCKKPLEKRPIPARGFPVACSQQIIIHQPPQLQSSCFPSQVDRTCVTAMTAHVQQPVADSNCCVRNAVNCLTELPGGSKSVFVINDSTGNSIQTSRLSESLSIKIESVCSLAGETDAFGEEYGIQDTTSSKKTDELGPEPLDFTMESITGQYHNGKPSVGLGLSDLEYLTNFPYGEDTLTDEQCKVENNTAKWLDEEVTEPLDFSKSAKKYRMPTPDNIFLELKPAHLNNANSNRCGVDTSAAINVTEIKSTSTNGHGENFHPADSSCSERLEASETNQQQDANLKKSTSSDFINQDNVIRLSQSTINNIVGLLKCENNSNLAHREESNISCHQESVYSAQKKSEGTVGSGASESMGQNKTSIRRPWVDFDAKNDNARMRHSVAHGDRNIATGDRKSKSVQAVLALFATERKYQSCEEPMTIQTDFHEVPELTTSTSSESKLTVKCHNARTLLQLKNNTTYDNQKAAIGTTKIVSVGDQRTAAKRKPSTGSEDSGVEVEGDTGTATAAVADDNDADYNHDNALVTDIPGTAKKKGKYVATSSADGNHVMKSEVLTENVRTDIFARTGQKTTVKQSIKVGSEQLYLEEVSKDCFQGRNHKAVSNRVPTKYTNWWDAKNVPVKKENLLRNQNHSQLSEKDRMGEPAEKSRKTVNTWESGFKRTNTITGADIYEYNEIDVCHNVTSLQHNGNVKGTQLQPTTGISKKITGQSPIPSKPMAIPSRPIAPLKRRWLHQHMAQDKQTTFETSQGKGTECERYLQCPDASVQNDTKNLKIHSDITTTAESSAESFDYSIGKTRMVFISALNELNRTDSEKESLHPPNREVSDYCETYDVGTASNTTTYNKHGRIKYPDQLSRSKNNIKTFTNSFSTGLKFNDTMKNTVHMKKNNASIGKLYEGTGVNKPHKVYTHLSNSKAVCTECPAVHPHYQRHHSDIKLPYTVSCVSTYRKNNRCHSGALNMADWQATSDRKQSSQTRKRKERRSSRKLVTMPRRSARLENDPYVNYLNRLDKERVSDHRGSLTYAKLTSRHTHSADQFTTMEGRVATVGSFSKESASKERFLNVQGQPDCVENGSEVNAIGNSIVANSGADTGTINSTVELNGTNSRAADQVADCVHVEGKPVLSGSGCMTVTGEQCVSSTCMPCTDLLQRQACGKPERNILDREEICSHTGSVPSNSQNAVQYESETVCEQGLAVSVQLPSSQNETSVLEYSDSVLNIYTASDCGAYETVHEHEVASDSSVCLLTAIESSCAEESSPCVPIVEENKNQDAENCGHDIYNLENDEVALDIEIPHSPVEAASDSEVEEQRSNPDKGETRGSSELEEKSEVWSSSVLPDKSETGGSSVLPDKSESGLQEESDSGGSSVLPDKSETVGSSELSDKSEIVGSSVLPDKSEIGGSSIVWDKSEIGGSSVVPDKSETGDFSVLPDKSETIGSSGLSDKSEIVGSSVLPDKSEIGVTSVVQDKSEIRGSSVVPDKSETGGFSTLSDKSKTGASSVVASCSPRGSSGRVIDLTSFGVKRSFVCLKDVGGYLKGRQTVNLRRSPWIVMGKNKQVKVVKKVIRSSSNDGNPSSAAGTSAEASTKDRPSRPRKKQRSSCGHHACSTCDSYDETRVRALINAIKRFEQAFFGEKPAEDNVELSKDILDSLLISGDDGTKRNMQDSSSSGESILKKLKSKRGKKRKRSLSWGRARKKVDSGVQCTSTAIDLENKSSQKTNQKEILNSRPMKRPSKVSILVPDPQNDSRLDSTHKSSSGNSSPSSESGRNIFERFQSIKSSSKAIPDHKDKCTEETNPSKSGRIKSIQEERVYKLKERLKMQQQALDSIRQKTVSATT